MLAGNQSLYDGGDLSIKISGSSGASGTARVVVRQGCPLSLILFGIFFDSLDAQVQAESAAAGVECRGARVPGLFYADDFALLSPSSQGLQQLLDTMQSFCVTNGLTISTPKTEVVVFGGGHQQCQWHVGGHRLKPVNLAFIWACCFMRTDTSSMRFSIAWLEAMRLRGPSSHHKLSLAVQILSNSLCGCNRQFCSLVPPMLVRCGLQPQLALALSGSFSSFGGPSSAELAVSRKVFLWISNFRSCNRYAGMNSGGGRVSSFWSASVEADTGSLHSLIFHDAIQLALAGCKSSWAAQVLQCFSALDELFPLVADAPIAIDIKLLQELFLRDRLASFDSLPQDPR